VTRELWFNLLLLFTTVAGNIENLRCPSKVKRFSSKVSQGHYYECDSEKNPILMKCPEGKLYHMQKQKCLSKEETPKNKALVEKAMGRGFELGFFYDAKKSELDPAFNFWSQSTIDSNKTTYDRKEVTTEFTADKYQRDKTSHFDISARLAMDFMSGMVSVEGAMSYLDDEVSSEKEVNVEMLYHTNRYTETLPKKTIKDHPEECKYVNNPFTHVVTSVTYGLDCNFVFKHLLQKDEEESQITGSLKIAINNIPSFAISGSGEVNLTDSEKNSLEHTSLKMYGDFSLNEGSLPTDFDSAVEFYKRLPILASEQATILEVYMTPIEDICKAEDYILNDISDSLMEEVLTMLDELDQLKVKISGLMNTHEANKFPALKKNLKKYKIALADFTNDNQALLKEMLPKIRSGESTAEEDLVSLLHDYTNSPFEFTTSEGFLIDRSREISALSFLLDSFPDEAENIAVVDYEEASDVDFILNHPFVIVLYFKILTLPSLTDSFLAGTPQDETNFWYNSIPVNGLVGNQLRSFSDFALENAGPYDSDYGYMINCQPIDESDEPTQMIAFNNGKNISNAYEVPPAPATPSIKDISYNSFSFNVKRFNEFTMGVQITIKDVFEETEMTQPFDWPNDMGEEVDILVSKNIQPATVYSIVIQYTTEVGFGPKSLNSNLFITAPSSPPSNLKTTDVTTSSFKVSWSGPENLGSGISESDLIYTVEIQDGTGYTQKKTTSTEKEFTFENLRDATAFNIKAITYIEQEDLGQQNETTRSLSYISTSQPAIIVQNSNPFAPKMIPSMPGEVTTNSMILRWEEPDRLPEFSSLSYRLSYGKENSDGDVDQWEEVVLNELYFELNGLDMATVYDAKVKIETDIGASSFSGVLRVKTKDEISDIGHFEDQIKDDLDDIVKDMKRRSSFCATKPETNQDGVLAFESLMLDHNNIAGATFDLNAGKFTAGATGSYQVMISAEAVSAPGQYHKLWVAVNDAKKDETLIYAEQGDHTYSSGFDNVSRDIVLKLDAGNTVTVVHETNGNENLVNVIFCVSSMKLSDN